MYLLFKYRGAVKINNKPVSGTVLATDHSAALGRLANIGIMVFSLRQRWRVFSYWHKIYVAYCLKFPLLRKQKCQQFGFLMSSLLKTGFSPASALQTMQHIFNGRFYFVLDHILADIQTGKRLDEAFAQCSGIFPSMLILALKNADSTQMLIKAFDLLHEKDELPSIVNTVILPLLPQILLLLFLFVLTIFIGYNYLQSLLRTAQFIGLETSGSSQSLVATSVFIVKHGSFVGMCLIMLGLFYILLTRFESFCLLRDMTLLKLPIVGKLITALNRARLFKNIYNLLTIGTTVQAAVFYSTSLLRNRIFTRELIQMSADIQNGETIGVSLRNVRLFSGTYGQILKTATAGSNFADGIKKLMQFNAAQLDLSFLLFKQIVRFTLYVFIAVILFWLTSAVLLLYVNVITFLLSSA